jgi:hypothetical protein
MVSNREYGVDVIGTGRPSRLRRLPPTTPAQGSSGSRKPRTATRRAADRAPDTAGPDPQAHGGVHPGQCWASASSRERSSRPDPLHLRTRLSEPPPAVSLCGRKARTPLANRSACPGSTRSRREPAPLAWSLSRGGGRGVLAAIADPGDCAAAIHRSGHEPRSSAAAPRC